MREGEFEMYICSRRDYFAAAALPGVIQTYTQDIPKAAEIAFKIADAMIVAADREEAAK